MKIIAIGGGGFTHQSHPALDDFCLAQTNATRPHIGFIGSASGDDQIKIDRFFDRFEGLAGRLTHLPASLGTNALSACLEGLDMVYIGGGDTEGMVASWRRNGWDRVLCDASKSGLTLAGVSAGAVCWFDRFLFNSGNGPLRPLRGLGLIAAGACPHYSTELERRAALHASVANGAMPTSFAIDDGVAVAFNGSSPVSICVAEQGADAYQVSCDEQGIVTEVALDI